MFTDDQRTTLSYGTLKKIDSFGILGLTEL